MKKRVMLSETELVIEYDREKNEKDPSKYTAHCRAKVWWKCKKGHSWKAVVASRMAGSGCPYCAGKKPIIGETDLVTLEPGVVAMFDVDKNEKAPQEYTRMSNKKVWWKCVKGHTWERPICSQVESKECPFCSGKWVIPGETDLETLEPELVKQYDREKNKRRPSEYARFSNERVFWLCDKEHSWAATIASRVKGAGCPYCFGRKVIPGETDLETLEPELVKEFDREKNKKSPREYTRGTKQEVWWKCLKKGHSWLARINNRVHGNGCPYCAGQWVVQGENDLATVRPDLVNEYDFEKNERMPQEYTGFSGEKVWWKCNKGHSWPASINSRTRVNGAGCPYCSGLRPILGETDLETMAPELVKEFDCEKNKQKPSEYTWHSSKAVWWKCKRGHSWQSRIYHRVDGHGCPYCTGLKAIPGETDIATLEPNLLKEYDFEKNKIKPCELTRASNKKVFWRCVRGHSWEATVNARATRGRGCPYCSGRYPIIGENDFETLEPDLAKEYDLSRNKKKPSEYLRFSNANVWWICKNGHSWKSTINHRTSGRGCPECAKKGV